MVEPEEKASPGGARSLRLRPRQRLGEAEFPKLREVRKVLYGSRIVIYLEPNGLSFSRLGVAVGRKHGIAVRRNRIKRVLREAFRLSQQVLPPGWDWVLVPRHGVKVFRTEEVRSELLRLAERIARPPRAR